MLSHPRPDESDAAADLRGRVFTDLDMLAFALEMEAARLLAEDREDEAVRCQERRLGVRLAQRLVTGVWADEVDVPLQRWKSEYHERLKGAAA